MTVDEVKSMLMASAGLKAYGIYFFILMSCSYGFPFNSDILMVTGGALAAFGLFDLKIIAIFSPIAILIGDTISFNVGRKYGKQILQTRLVKKIFPVSVQDRMKVFLKRNSRQFVFMIRFIPGLRTLIFVFAGSMQIEPKIFYQMNILSTCMYAPALVFMSYTTASQIQDASLGGQSYSKWVLSIGVFLGLVMLIRQFGRKFWIQTEGAK